MKIIKLILIFLLLASCSTKQNCKNLINFQIFRVFPDDEFEIRIKESDSTVYKKRFEKYFLIDGYKPRQYIFKDYCINSDSLKIHFIVNGEKDTIFYLNSSQIETLYFGCDQQDRISIYHDFKYGTSELTFE
jgi:hypothetical protein